MRNRHSGDEDNEDLRRALHCRRFYRSRDLDDEDEQWFREEEEWPEDHDDLIRLVKTIELDREKLNADTAALASLLRRQPQLRDVWRSFTSKGGITAAEFRKFLAGQFRPRLIRQRKHLRLIVNRQRKAVTDHAPNGDAA